MRAGISRASRPRWALATSALLKLVLLATLVGATTPGGVWAAEDPIDPPNLSGTDYHGILEHCAPAWDPADRNIYTRDGFSLNDVDRATRTSFVTEWQLDAWPRWRWEAECLGSALPRTLDTPTAAIGAASTATAAPNPVPDSPSSPTGLPVGDYREILDRCTPTWNPADRNIYTTDGFSLNDVDRATRTSFVTVWQLDAWPRWRWEVECLGTLFTWSAGGTSTAPATLSPTPESPTDYSSLPSGDYRKVLENCAPTWDRTNRSIYTTDGFSLNDVDRATRTSFVTVWQLDAWPRWRWEANCLQGATATSAVAEPGGSVSSPGTVRATYDPFDPPALPAEAYLALLSHCAPAWDPMDRNIYTPDGFSLNDVDPATRTSFVDTWQLDAWPRWRWEVNCLQGATATSVVAEPKRIGVVARHRASHVRSV